MEEKKLICDCCNKNEALGVASSGIVAMSFAFCRECIQNNAEPELVFEYLWEISDGEPEALRPEALDGIYTYKGGEYVLLRNWMKNKANENITPIA